MTEVEAIRGSYSNLLSGVRVVLLISSGISLYRSIDLARLLIRHGADVHTFMTPRAARLISPILFHWATGRRPVVRLTGGAEHIEVCTKADVLVAAPATANTLVKLSLGVADNAALTCALASAARSKWVIVPAMNLAMWEAPQVKDALEKLRGKGALIVPPLVEEDKAKYPPPEEVAEWVIDTTAPRDMEGLRVLVTAGPTHEHIDDVKYISTPSSGLTGVYFAREAAARGAKVTLVAGPGVRAKGPFEVVNVVSVMDMHKAVMERASQQDLFIFAAAPLDFYVERRTGGKIDSSLKAVEIKLVQAPKIAGEVKRINPGAVVIGFKAEYGVSEEELISKAKARMEAGSWDMALAHDVSKMGFGTIKDQYVVLTRDGAVEKIGPAHKRELARLILSKALKFLK